MEIYKSKYTRQEIEEKLDSLSNNSSVDSIWESGNSGTNNAKIGTGNTNSGNDSVVIGSSNNNQGANSLIVGSNNTNSTKTNSIVLGSSNTNNHGNNLVLGVGNESNNNNGIVLGQTAEIRENDIFTIGNGFTAFDLTGKPVTQTKHSSFSIQRNGGIYINETPTSSTASLSLLQDILSSHKTSINNNATNISSIQSDISGLKTSIGGINSNISNLSNRVTMLEYVNNSECGARDNCVELIKEGNKVYVVFKFYYDSPKYTFYSGEFDFTEDASTSNSLYTKVIIPDKPLVDWPEYTEKILFIPLKYYNNLYISPDFNMGGFPLFVYTIHDTADYTDYYYIRGSGFYHRGAMIVKLIKMPKITGVPLKSVYFGISHINSNR